MDETEFHVEEVFSGKPEICNKILRALPGWFGIEEAILHYVSEAEEMPMFAARIEGEEVGFASIKIHNRCTAEIYVMGILPEYHRRGIGRKLVGAIEDYLRKRGAMFMTVKTLADSQPHEGYARTRRFYLAMGFYPIEVFERLWDEHNPCLLLLKAL